MLRDQNNGSRHRTVPTYSSLSAPRRTLITLFQELGFGRIEGLVVRGGEPVLDPPPRIIRTLKFGADTGARPAAGLGDFTLKTQVVCLFATLDEIGEGVIDSLTIANGLPLLAEVPA